LAVLEAVRMQAVMLVQKDLFGEIALQRQPAFDQVFASGEPLAAIEKDYL
jgi:chromatin segregation and condensation protein Rec8/ScpA/Scc1 (kleisin family)